MASDNGGTTSPAAEHNYYEWIGREDTKEYVQSIEKWRAHTNEERFATEFKKITRAYEDENALRTERVETFLVEEAIRAGVVKICKHKI